MALRALARGHTDLDREARGNPPPSLASAAPEVVSRIRDFVYQWLPLAYQVHASVGIRPPALRVCGEMSIVSLQAI